MPERHLLHIAVERRMEKPVAAAGIIATVSVSVSAALLAFIGRHDWRGEREVETQP